MPTAPRVSTTNKPHIDNNKIRAQAGETSIGIGIPNESGSQIPLQSIPLSKVSTSSDTSNQKHQNPLGPWKFGDHNQRMVPNTNA
jgi:dihydroxyacetone kinase